MFLQKPISAVKCLSILLILKSMCVCFFVFFGGGSELNSLSHLLGTVTTQCLDSDGVVTVDNCRQHGD